MTDRTRQATQEGRTDGFNGYGYNNTHVEGSEWWAAYNEAFAEAVLEKAELSK